MVWLRKSYFAGFYEKFIKLKGKILVSTCKIAYKNFTEPFFLGGEYGEKNFYF